MVSCVRLITLEGDLLALEAAATAAATTETSPTTATTTTAATEVTTATTTTSAAASTETTATATTATTEAAAATVVVTGLSIVKTDRATLQVRSIESVKGRLGILNRGEGNIAETLGATGLPDTFVSSLTNNRVLWLELTGQ